MLFKVESSIIEGFDNPTARQSVISGLDELARAYQKGYHLLYADKQTLQFLSKNSLLSKRTRSTYKHLLSNFTELKIPFSFVDKYVEVFWGGNILQIDIIGGFEVIKVPINLIAEKSFTSEGIFLAENKQDIEFYQKLFEVYCYRNKITGIRIKYQQINGGGYNIADQFKTIKEEFDRLCLSIVDSDRKYPDGNEGNTAHAIMETYKNSQPVCELIVLSPREIENLIPLSLYAEISDSSKDRQVAYSYLQRIDKSEARFFIDIKKGICLYPIVQSSNKSYSTYWKRVCKEIGINSNCLNGRDCDKGEKDDKCEGCKPVPGFGDPLPDINEIAQRKTIMKLSEAIPDHLITHWEVIGNKLLTWFCAKMPMSVF